jgi:hypothetical protein
MAFSFMTIEKIKTHGSLNSKYNHNCRLASVENADPEKANLNDELVPLPAVGDRQMSYNQAWHQRVDSLPYYKTHNLRPDQVLAFEVVLTYSRDADLNVEEWKQRSTDWLKKTFNVAQDGQSNLLHVAFHDDEAGNPHIHAIVIPVDEQGRLNASRFTNGSRVLSQMQTSYAKSVEDLGLERGLMGSSAKHKEIRRMYATLNNATQLPEVQANETPEQYWQRIQDSLRTQMAVGYRAVDDYMTKRRREMDKQAMEQRTAISQEAQSMRASIKNELADVQQELEKTARELAKKQMEREQAEAQVERYLKKVGAYERQRAVLVREIYETRLKLQDMDKGYQFYQDFQQGNERIARTNPEAARTVQDVVTFVMEEADMAKQEELARQEAEQEEQNQQTKRDEEEADL